MNIQIYKKNGLTFMKSIQTAEQLVDELNLLGEIPIIFLE